MPADRMFFDLGLGFPKLPNRRDNAAIWKKMVENAPFSLLALISPKKSNAYFPISPYGLSSITLDSSPLRRRYIFEEMYLSERYLNDGEKVQK